MSEVIFNSLTNTERKIVKEYLELRDISPKELATRLNVSVRTVYKALYKYRRELKKLGKVDEAEKLKRKRGRRPQKIIDVKDISVSNVSNVASKAIYDAIYQYLLNILKEGLFGTNVRKNEISLLIDSINELKRSILLLNQNILYLIQNMGNKNIKERSLEKIERLSNAPSFLIDNPWIEVLKERD